jgi:hypothetical protein
MQIHLKPACILLALTLVSGCVSIDLPGVISDTARVTKDAYKSVAGKKDERDGTVASVDTVSNTYIGQDNQTVAEVKQLCVGEAAAKLFKAVDKEVPYTVIENTISTVNNAVAANCKVTADKGAPAPPSAKK